MSNRYNHNDLNSNRAEDKTSNDVTTITTKTTTTGKRTSTSNTATATSKKQQHQKKQQPQKHNNNKKDIMNPMRIPTKTIRNARVSSISQLGEIYEIGGVK